MAGGDPCMLVPDPAATFGQPVTADRQAMSRGAQVCEWKNAEGRICGSITVFGPGWNPVPDVRANYAALLTSMGAFGAAKDVAGVGEEARIVDGGMFGTQLAFRTAKTATLVSSACRSGQSGSNELVEKLAREVAPKL